MTIDKPIQRTMEQMPGLVPGLYCGIVNVATGECVNIGRATREWESEEVYAPEDSARSEFARIAVAAYPDRPSGFVNIWLQVSE